MEISKIYKTWIFIIALIFMVILIYLPHFNYKYPLHIDEWQHIESAKRLINDKKMLGSLYFGYYIFLVILFKLEEFLHINPILAYKFLPLIFAMASSLILFFFMHKLTRNFLIAIFSIIFFASLPTDVNLMGLWFAIPHTLAFPFIFLFFFLFLKGTKKENIENQEHDRRSFFKNKDLFFATVILFIIFFIHPPSASFIFPILLVFFIINYKKIKSNKKHFFIFLPYILFTIFVFLLFKVVRHKSFIDIFNFILDKLIYEHGATPLEPSVLVNPMIINFFGKTFFINQYFLPVLYGIIPFILALFGLYFCLKNRKFEIFYLWFLVSAFLLFLFNLIDVSFFARRQHMIYYCMLSLVPLSAIGLQRAVSFIKNKIGEYTEKRKIIRNVIVVLIIIFVLITTFYNYGQQRKGTELYFLIDEADYQALLFLKTQAQNKMIMTTPQIGMVVYSVSNNKPVGKLQFGDEKKKEIAEKFFVSNCTEKEKITKGYRVDYILSKEKINCNFREIYSNETFIYKIGRS